MIRVNLKSVYSIIHFSVPQMIKQKSGKIIPSAPPPGSAEKSFHTHYGASKGGIISLAKGLATELARHNILVNCVAPGLGGHGHVQRGNQLESGRKSHCLRDSPASRGHCGGNCRTDFVPRFGSGQLHDWRNHQCKRGSGVVRLKAVNSGRFWRLPH